MDMGFAGEHPLELAAGLAIGARTTAPLKRRKLFFAVGLIGNLAALAWFKYAALRITTYNDVADSHMPRP